MVKIADKKKSHTKDTKKQNNYGPGALGNRPYLLPCFRRQGRTLSCVLWVGFRIRLLCAAPPTCCASKASNWARIVLPTEIKMNTSLTHAPYSEFLHALLRVCFHKLVPAVVFRELLYL